MSELREIYQEVILDHYRNPRNFHAMPEASHHATGHNPLCGDRFEIFLQVEDGIVRSATFEGNGCAISTASASLMTEAIKGQPLEEVHRLFNDFHNLLTDPDADAEASGESLGKLEALSGVRLLPVRIKCATLAWHTLEAALEAKRSEKTKASSE